MKTKFKLSNRILSLVLAFVMVLGMMPMMNTTVHAAYKFDDATEFSFRITNLVMEWNGERHEWGESGSSLDDTTLTKVADGKYQYKYKAALSTNGGTWWANPRTVTFDGIDCESDYYKSFEFTESTSVGNYTMKWTYTLEIVRSGTAGHMYGAWSDNGDGTHSRTCSIDSAHIETASHNFNAATCSAPQICKNCNATQGESIADAHGWNAATCVLPQTCRYCGATQGEALGHDIVAATFGKPAACSRCGATDINSTVLEAATINSNINLPSKAVKADNLGYDDITWSVVNAGSTGATINGNNLKAFYAGEAVIRATTASGSKEFTILFKSSENIDISLATVTVSKKDDSTLIVAYAGFTGGSREYHIGEPIVITGTTTTNMIVVNSPAVANIHLNNVNISGNFHNIDIKSGAEAIISLIGTNTLKTGNDKTAAIHVPSGAKVTLEGEGTLDATNTSRGSAIGSVYQENAGNIIINGGTITAKNTYEDNYSGAGIGSGNNGSGGTITINGGNVIASSYKGAGIGGGSSNGHSAGCGTITINGGVITAESSSGAAGIGSGAYQQKSGTIIINGGTIVASSKTGAGIGSSFKGKVDSITINGGNIKASSSGGEAVGKGKDGSGSVTVKDGNGNSVSKVTITLNEAAADTAVTAIAGMTYGINDVKTLDTNKLYFYLPSGAAATSITAGGTEYICKSGSTYYANHDWSNKDGVCIRCGATCSHEGESGTCSVCGKVLHTHKYIYEVDGTTIKATCNNTDNNCTSTGGGSVTLVAEDAYYKGSAIAATVEGSFTNGATYVLTYTDGTETAPNEVGTYTAILTVFENGTEKASVSAEYTILYLTAPENAYSISGGYKDGDTYWFKDNATITVEAPEGYTISTALDGTYGESVSFSENDSKVVYLKRTSDGAMTNAITISETISFDADAPTGKITIESRGFWEKLINKITFGLFFKGDKVATVTTADNDGSGVKSIQYYLADKDLVGADTLADADAIAILETAIDGNWSDYNKEIALTKNAKYVIYVKITDNVGNVTYINSEGIVLYTDAEADTESVSTIYKAGKDKDATVKLNGNTVKSIANGTITLTAGTDYTVSTDGVITLKATYLDTLNAGEYTFTVSYNPLGLEYTEATENDVPATTTFKVTVERADGAVTNISAQGKTYDGKAVAEPTYTSLSTGKATFEYKLKGADDSTYTTVVPSDTGDYVVCVTVAADTNYKEASDTAEFTIDRAKITNVSVKQNGTLTYNGKALTPIVSTNAVVVNKQPVTFTYSMLQDGTYGTLPSFDKAGSYTVYYKATAPNHNEVTDYFTVTVAKATVTEPTIASKPYTGEAQTADVATSDLYTVEKNNGGTAKGNYDVVLKLKDADNYKWATDTTGESATVTLQFVISAAQNSWNNKPEIDGWTYGQSANAPTYEAKFGNDTVKVTYVGTANDGTTWNSEDAPEKAGTYKAIFTVDATGDYGSLLAEVEFTIAKAPVTVTADDAAKTYGDSDPTAFIWQVTKGVLIGKDALDVNISREAGENATTYAIKVSQDENANPNYDITFVNGTFTIKKAELTVTAEDKSVTYGDSAPNYTVKITGWKNGDTKDVLGGKLKFTCDYAKFSDKGSYTIKASGYEADNYTFNYVDGTLSVSAKPITVTIENKTSIYGDDIATLTASDNGIVNNDTNVYKLTTIATNSSAVGKYDITGEALDDNYSITFANEDNAYEITTRELTVSVVVANKQYDGLNGATITSATLNNVVDADKDKITLVNGTATFTSVNAAENISIAFTDFALSGEADVLKNYTLTQPTGVKASITNGWNPTVDTEYTVSAPNSNGWLNTDLVITARDGFELSRTNTADGTWTNTLDGVKEGADSTEQFYIRNTNTGAISELVTVNYKLDKNTESTTTTGKVSFDERNGWESFLNTISFGLFYKDEVTVKVEATDKLSEVESIEYYAVESASATALTLEQVQALADDAWTTMPADGVGVTVEDAKQFVYYIRITDKAGNETYLSTNGAEYDTTLPAVSGVEDGKTYYTTQVVTIEDKNLESVVLKSGDADAETVTLDNGKLTLAGDVDTTYTITVTDKAGNVTTVVVTMKEIASVKEAIKDITEDDVTSSDKDTVQDVIDHVDELLKDDDLTEDEKKALEDIKTEAGKLIEKINEADAADETEDINKVKDITSENVTTDDKEDLEKAKEDLEKALEDYKDNLTEDEKKAIQDEIDRIDDALDIIEKVESVEEQIDKLPSKITKDDADEVDAAKKAYDGLSDYEKTLIDPNTKKKLDAALKAVDEINAPKTGDSSDYATSVWMMLSSLAAMFGILFGLKKKKEEE